MYSIKSMKKRMDEGFGALDSKMNESIDLLSQGLKLQALIAKYMGDFAPPRLILIEPTKGSTKFERLASILNPEV